MKRFWLKQFMAFHAFLIRATGGRLGTRWGRLGILLLYTTGRKSGKRMAIPTGYFRDGENYILVASNWGGEHNPGWYYNLKSQPAAEIQVGRQPVAVTARPATGGEYDRLWQLACAYNPGYKKYEEMTKRKIPILVLTPDSGEPG